MFTCEMLLCSWLCSCSGSRHDHPQSWIAGQSESASCQNRKWTVNTADRAPSPPSCSIHKCPCMLWSCATHGFMQDAIVLTIYFVTTSASACTHMHIHPQHLMIRFKLQSFIRAKQFSSSVFLLEHFFHFYRCTELLLCSLIGLSPVTPDDASHLTATLNYVSRLIPASVARVQLLSCTYSII